RDDGFLHRILFVFPRASPGADWTDVTVSQQSREAWEKTLKALRALAMEDMDDGAPGPRAVSLSPAAKEAWVAWYDAHAAETCSPGLPLQLMGPWGKLKSYAARLALVMHYLWVVQGQGTESDLEAVCIERAVKLIDYFKCHLRLVYGRLRVTPEDNHLLEVL